MIKRLIFAIILFSMSGFVFAQKGQILLNIKPDTTVTNDRVTFNCSIINHSKRTFKAIPIRYDCNDSTTTIFWELKILKGGNTYYDFSYNIILPNPPYWSENRILKGEQINFKICVNFDKLVMESKMYIPYFSYKIKDSISPNTYHEIKPKNYFNNDYGDYSIQLIYPSRIDRAIDTLLSNIVIIKYKEKQPKL
jgi:hypothetical protein